MMDFSWLSFKGELAALAAALIWAIASFLFMHLGQRLPPLVLNVAKSGIAIALLLLTLLLLGDRFPAAQTTGLLLLGISGAIGIGCGDTAYFGSINCLGARRAILLESLAPPIAAILAWIFLGERLSAIAWLGIGLTVGGVSWVVVERTPQAVSGNYRPWRGVGFGLVAAVGQALGSVLSRAALADTPISPLWSTLIRLSGGVLVLLVCLLFRRQTLRSIKQARSPRFLSVLVGTAFLGTYLGIWLQQTALKYTAAGIAQSLTSTSPLFVIPMAIALKEPVSLRAILGVWVAIAGIWLLFSLR